MCIPIFTDGNARFDIKFVHLNFENCASLKGAVLVWVPEFY